MSNYIVLTEYYQKANYYRGLVLNEFILFELVMEQTITNRFFGESDDQASRDFKNVILNRMNLEGKRTALKFIFDKVDEDNGFVKSKNNSYPNNKLFNEVRRLIEERNRFAHYFSLKPVDKPNSVLGLAEFRDKGKIHPYSEDDISKLLKQISEVRGKLLNLYYSTGAVPDSSNPAELPSP